MDAREMAQIFRVTLKNHLEELRIDSGMIKEWKVIVKTTHYPWGG